MTPMNAINPIVARPLATDAASPREQRLAEARGLQEAYGQFVGETLYGSMLKSMRATVGEPAYFHGGSAERHFQARLDQQMAADLAAADGSNLAKKLFNQQFPEQAELLRDDAAAQSDSLDALNSLRRI